MVFFETSCLQFVTTHMAVIHVHRNTTAVNNSQVAIKYIFDLAVRNVRDKVPQFFSRGCICFSHNIL